MLNNRYSQKMTEVESWVKVRGFESLYEVSSLGRIAPQLAVSSGIRSTQLSITDEAN